MMVMHAAALEAISVDDVKRAALGLGVLPPNIAPPAPIQTATEEAPSETDQPAESAPEGTEGSDS
jgi:hypothetical protein